MMPRLLAGALADDASIRNRSWQLILTNALTGAAVPYKTMCVKHWGLRGT